MGFALAVLFIWAGCVLIWVAAHGTQASTPWAAYQQVTEAWQKGA